MAWTQIFTWEFLKRCMEIGGGIFVFIQGLKNVPFFADFFAAWPKLAVYVNAAMAFCAGILVCLAMSAHDSAFYMCIATTVGVFLSAAGFHMIAQKISPDSSTSPSVNPARVEKLSNGKQG